jgi:hypothetical protein
MAMSKMDVGKMQEAMAMRVKYRVNPSSPKRRVGLRSMGVHMLNRGPAEIYPNGTDVKTLGVSLVASCLDLAEADHNGIVVEEIPADVRASSAVAGHFMDPHTGKQYEGIGRYNLAMCLGSNYLQTCYNNCDIHGVIYGTLSHSHLLLFLLCAMTGAKWDIVDDAGSPKFPCGQDGRLDRSAVADRDGVFAYILNAGIDVEVLSYKIYIEAPTACMLISDAMNNAQGVALQRTELQALAALTAEVGTRTELNLASRVSFQAVKDALRLHLDTLVDEPEFVEMFDFVLGLGADKNTYLPGFLMYCSKFVSSKHRRLRIQTCAILNRLKAGPLSKIALAKRCLRLKPVGIMCPTPESALEKVEAHDFCALEEALHFFHQDCKAAVAALPEDEMVKLLGNVDCAAAEAFVKSLGKQNGARKAVAEATVKYWEKLKEGPHAVKPVVNMHFPTFASVQAKQKEASAVAEKKHLAEPCLIVRDQSSGDAFNNAETRRETVNTFERIRLPWLAWAQSEPAAQLDELKAAEAAALCVLQLLHRQSCSAEPPLDVLWDPKENTTVVVTTDRVDAFKLYLAPCIPKTMKLRSDSEHPERIKITVNAKQQGAKLWTRDLFLHPEWQGPADEKVEGLHAVACEHRPWQWTGEETMHPHWALRRLTKEKLAVKVPGGHFNLRQENKEFSVVSVGSIGAEYLTVDAGLCALSTTVQLPILTNPLPIGTGVELLWEASSAPKKAARGLQTWKDDEKVKQADAKALKNKKAKVDVTKPEGGAAMEV